MNNKQLYLAWLRTVAPTVYVSALRRATGQIQNLGGLTDNLLQQALAPNISHSFLGDDTTYMDTTFADFGAPAGSIDNSQIAPTSIDFQTPSFDASQVSSPINETLSFQAPVAPPASTVAGSSSTFSNILTAVTAIGAGVINATNQSKLIQLNTTRAQQGLPPVNAAGQVVSPTGFGTTSPSLLAFERAISGGTSGSMLPIILGVLGIGAVLLFSKRSA